MSGGRERRHGERNGELRRGGEGGMGGHRAGGRDRMPLGGFMCRPRVTSPRRDGGRQPNPAQARRNPDLAEELRGGDMGTGTSLDREPRTLPHFI